MSLTRMDTGEASRPLEQLQAMNEKGRVELESSLLKEALAISNEKCNSLIGEQNTLIRDLTAQVNQIKENNENAQLKIRYQALTVVDKAEKIIEEERQFKTQVSHEIAEAIQGTADEVTAYAKLQMDKSAEEVKKQLAESAKEIERQREEMRLQSGFRRFLFWATPILLVAQTIALIISMLS